MNEAYLYKNIEVEAIIKDIDGKKGIVTGYFSHFNNVDAQGDIIRPGAFRKSISEIGPGSARPRIKHLLNHDISQPLGVLLSLKEDGSGLAYESQVGSHNLGQDFIKMVESGLVTEHSFGGRVMKSNKLQTYEEYTTNPQKGWYELTEVKIMEGSSLTAWGANEMTPLTSLKSDTIENQISKMLDRQKKIEKFCRNTTATDETIELLLIENSQLTQSIIDLSKQLTKPETSSSTLPNEWMDALTTFNKSLKSKENGTDKRGVA